MNIVEKMMLRYEHCYKIGRMPWIHDKIAPDIKSFVKLMEKECKGGKILDLGSGNGWLSCFLAEKGFEVCGIECSKKAVELSREKALNCKGKVNFKIGNALDFPFSHDFFDVVVDRGFFHHVPENKWAVYKKGLNKVLKRGGYFYLETFSNKTVRNFGAMPKKGKMWRMVKDSEGFMTYDHFFTKEIVEKNFKKDFELINFSEDGKPKPHGTHLLYFTFRKK